MPGRPPPGLAVLNIGKLAAGGERYYLDTVASGVEDYYTGSGEAPGYWTGAASGGLGLSGEVNAEALRAVLGGAHPGSGQPLGSYKSGRTVPGFDCTFRAPKSVSLLWALGDAAVAERVRDAHDAAVAAGLSYLEERAGYSRRGAGGCEAVAVRGFVAAAFRHRTSRAGDPLLHTHVLVSNIAQAVDDGRWRTLDARRLYTHAKTAGCLYQAVLRDELTRRLGVDWQPAMNGVADLARVPRPVIEAFSQRRAEILAHMAERGETSAKAAQVATLATRRAKDHEVQAEGLHERWQEQATALGWGPRQAMTLIGAIRLRPLQTQRVEATTTERASPMLSAATRAAAAPTKQVGASTTEPASPTPSTATRAAALQSEQMGATSAEPASPTMLTATRSGPLQPAQLEQAHAQLAGPTGLTARSSTFTRRDVVQAWCNRLRHGGQAPAICRLADDFLATDDAVPLAPVPHARQPESADVATVVEAVATAACQAAAPDVLGSAMLRRCVTEILAVSGWTAGQVHAALLARELGSAEDPAAVLTWRAQRLLGALDPEALSRVSGHLSGQAVIRRDDGRVVLGDPDERRYSTPELLALEHRVITRAIGRRDDQAAIVPAEHTEDVLRRRPAISGEQAAMVRRLTTSGAGVDVVVGRAGSGKTYALDAARAAWQAAGVHVMGTALAARAAAELGASAGIDSRTLDALLADLDLPPRQGGGLAAGSVVVVDEAGMVGTRKVARLLDHADKAGAKVVLVGDHHQLPEVDAGGVFRGLVNRLPVVELTENRRQRNPWEHAALAELRHGSAEAAVTAYNDAGRIHVGDTADDTREQLVSDWWTAREEHGPDSGVMIAARVADVEDLNTRARDRMTTAGHLTGAELLAGDRRFRRGDEIVCLRNDRRAGVINGSRGHVTHIDADAGTIAIALANGRAVSLPTEYVAAGHLTHGYALTAHKAQGLTCDRAWVLGSDAAYREWGYTALSRHRDQVDLYAVGARDPEPDAHPHTLQPDAPDPVTALTRTLARSRGQHLATDRGSAINLKTFASQRADVQVRPETLEPSFHSPHSNATQAEVAIEGQGVCTAR